MIKKVYFIIAPIFTAALINTGVGSSVAQTVKPPLSCNQQNVEYLIQANKIKISSLANTTHGQDFKDLQGKVVKYDKNNPQKYENSLRLTVKEHFLRLFASGCKIPSLQKVQTKIINLLNNEPHSSLIVGPSTLNTVPLGSAKINYFGDELPNGQYERVLKLNIPFPTEVKSNPMGGCNLDFPLIPAVGPNSFKIGGLSYLPIYSHEFGHLDFYLNDPFAQKKSLDSKKTCPPGTKMNGLPVFPAGEQEIIQSHENPIRKHLGLPLREQY